MNTDSNMIKLSIEKQQPSNSSESSNEDSLNMQISDGIQSSSVVTNNSCSTIQNENQVNAVEKRMGLSSTKKHKHKHHHHHHHHRKSGKYLTKYETIIPSKLKVMDSMHQESKEEENQQSIVDHHNEIKKEPKIDDILSSNSQAKALSRSNSSFPDDDVAQSSIKADRANIPLKTVENNLLFRREASSGETQVSTFPAMVCTSSIPANINQCCIQEIERIYIEDDCCVPATTIGCVNNPCMVNQSAIYVCCPQQQQQQQMLLCTNQNASQYCICSTSANNPVQQISVPATNCVCVNRTPAVSICNPVTANVLSCQCVSCTSQLPCQGNTNIIIQQQPQKLQIIPAVQAQPTMQTNAIILPLSTAQLALACCPGQVSNQSANTRHGNTPAGKDAQSGPNMFRHALNRNFAEQTGLPLPLQYAGGPILTVSPPTNIPAKGPLPITSSSPILLCGTQKSATIPMISLSADAALMQCQPALPKEMISGAIPRSDCYPPIQCSYGSIRQQIEHRARLLADLQHDLKSKRMSSSLVSSQNRRIPSPPIRSTTLSRTPLTYPYSDIAKSKTSYRSRNAFDSSDSSSDESVTSPTSPKRSSSVAGPYLQSSFIGSRASSSTLSRPSTAYRSVRP